MTDPDARGHEVVEWLGFVVTGVPPGFSKRTRVQNRACETHSGADALLGLAKTHGWDALRIEQVKRLRK